MNNYNELMRDYEEAMAQRERVIERNGYCSQALEDFVTELKEAIKKALES